MSAQPENVPQPSAVSLPNEVAAAGSDTPTASTVVAAPKTDPTPWGLLSLLAENLDDLERARIAAENRARSLAQVYGLEGERPHASAVALATALQSLEHGAELELKRAIRRHPLGGWIKATAGVGEKQGARLLAAIGDPYWNTLHNRPRTVSELWAYCGYHVLPVGHGTCGPHGGPADGGQHSDPAIDRTRTQVGVAGVAARRRRGARANWSNTAKVRAHLIAESCMKQVASPYRAVYDAGRAKYAESVHHAECAQCGTKGSPAPLGSPLSAGHQHARALRLVAKAVLRDLWLESKRLHEGGSA